MNPHVAINDSGHRPHFDNALEMLRDAVARRPQARAITFREQSYSYRDYGRCVAGFARIIDSGGVGGERVALILPNCAEFSFAVFAAMAAGAQVAMLNPRFTLAELDPLLEDVAPVLIVTTTELKRKLEGSGRRERIIDIEQDLSTARWCADETLILPCDLVDSDGLAYLLYTGGTTGMPKGVDHSHRDLILTIEGMEYSWPSRNDVEVWLGVAPMFHSWGFLTACMCPVYGAAHCIIRDRFEAETVIADLARHRVTIFGGGPAPIYASLLRAQNLDRSDLTALRVCPSGGSLLTEAVAEEWLEKTGIRITPGYGMTEISPITSCRGCVPGDADFRPGSVGKAGLYVELRVASLDGQDDGAGLPPGEPGEILVRAPHALDQYRNRPAETASTIVDGWVHTGDIGYLDDEGFLYLMDRKNDLIIVNGFNVYPQEIDRALCRHEAIREAATIGVADRDKGEVPVSFVVPENRNFADSAAVLRYLRSVLAGYKMPAFIVFLDELPTTAANKIDRCSLRLRHLS